ncbi:MAG TPA: DUF1697 domain-containing protein [Bacteroidales bacterium]|nr:DUF1697 domain-containing protein [Bacteroidales bacterium]
METYISLLRGINVGGKNSVSMETIRSVYAMLGLDNIQTYVQSGNIVFNSLRDAEELSVMISNGIARASGFPVEVILRKYDVWKEMIRHNPFAGRKEINEKHIYFTLLKREPKPELLKSISHQDFLPDEWHYYDETIYLYCPNGYGRTKINNNFFERKLKVPATTRNRKTVLKLTELAETSA